MKEKARIITDEAVEAEIARLQSSPLVALGRREEKLKERRKRLLYKLRGWEKRGRELTDAGITREELERIYKDTETE